VDNGPVILSRLSSFKAKCQLGPKIGQVYSNRGTSRRRVPSQALLRQHTRSHVYGGGAQSCRGYSTNRSSEGKKAISWHTVVFIYMPLTKVVFTLYFLHCRASMGVTCSLNTRFLIRFHRIIACSQSSQSIGYQLAITRALSKRLTWNAYCGCGVRYLMSAAGPSLIDDEDDDRMLIDFEQLASVLLRLH
jgi:hypothetical protein